MRFELNIDYLVAVGILIPVAYCGPFLLVKVQVGAGYFLGMKWSELVRSVLVLLAFLLHGLLHLKAGGSPLERNLRAAAVWIAARYRTQLE